MTDERREYLYGHIRDLNAKIDAQAAEIERLKLEFTTCPNCGHTAIEHQNYGCTHTEKTTPPPGYDGAEWHCVCFLSREYVLGFRAAREREVEG